MPPPQQIFLPGRGDVRSGSAAPFRISKFSKTISGSGRNNKSLIPPKRSITKRSPHRSPFPCFFPYYDSNSRKTDSNSSVPEYTARRSKLILISLIPEAKVRTGRHSGLCREDRSGFIKRGLYRAPFPVFPGPVRQRFLETDSNYPRLEYIARRAKLIENSRNPASGKRGRIGN